MMEALFGYSTADQKRQKRKESSSSESTPQFIKIIYPNKSLNLAILLKALNVTSQEVCDALTEGNELPAEFIQNLLKMAPTVDEELKLRMYTGDLSLIGPAERFLKALIEIPFAFKRLEALLFVTTFQEEFSTVKKSLATLEELPIGIGTFSNLKRLDICVRASPKTKLIPYLVGCPFLEELHLNLCLPEKDSRCLMKEFNSNHVIVLHAKLKKVEMNGFRWTDNEFAFALCILKSASALKQMCISMYLKYHNCIINGSSRLEGTFRPSSWSEMSIHDIEQRLQVPELSNSLFSANLEVKLIIQHLSRSL